MRLVALVPVALAVSASAHLRIVFNALSGTLGTRHDVTPIPIHRRRSVNATNPPSLHCNYIFHSALDKQVISTNFEQVHRMSLQTGSQAKNHP